MFLLLSALHGLLLQVFYPVSPPALTIPVAVLSCFVLRSPLWTHGLLMMVVFLIPFLVNLLLFAVFMPPIAILIMIVSLRKSLIWLILLSPLFLWVISTQVLIVQKIAEVKTLLTLVVRAPLIRVSFLMLVVLWIFGAIFTLTLLVLLGPKGIVLLPPRMIFVVYPMSGSLLFPPVCPFSDHCALFLSLSVPEVVPPGPGLWKLNTSILSDEVYCNLITDAWRDWRFSVPRFPSLAKWWEEGKSLLRGLTIKYCCEKSRACSDTRDLLVRLLNHLKAKVDGGSSSCVGSYHSALAELAKLDLEVARGAQVRSRAHWVEESETSSAYFLRLEKKFGADCWISAIRLDNGTIVSSPTDLCKSFAAFYTSLFSAEPTDHSVSTSLLGNISASLSSDEAALCERLLTVD